MAELLKRRGFSKPLMAYVAGRVAKPGMGYDHARAIIERGVGDSGRKNESTQGAEQSYWTA